MSYLVGTTLAVYIDGHLVEATILQRGTGSSRRFPLQVETPEGDPVWVYADELAGHSTPGDDGPVHGRIDRERYKPLVVAKVVKTIDVGGVTCTICRGRDWRYAFTWGLQPAPGDKLRRTRHGEAGCTFHESKWDAKRALEWFITRW